MTEIQSTEEIMAEIRRLEYQQREHARAIKRMLDWRWRAKAGGGSAKDRRKRRRALFAEAKQFANDAARLNQS